MAKTPLSDKQLETLKSQGITPRGTGFVGPDNKFVSDDTVMSSAKNSMNGSILSSFGLKLWNATQPSVANSPKANPVSDKDEKASLSILATISKILYSIENKIKAQTDLQKSLYQQSLRNTRENRLESAIIPKEPKAVPVKGDKEGDGGGFSGGTLLKGIAAALGLGAAAEGAGGLIAGLLGSVVAVITSGPILATLLGAVGLYLANKGIAALTGYDVAQHAANAGKEILAGDKEKQKIQTKDRKITASEVSPKKKDDSWLSALKPGGVGTGVLSQKSNQESNPSKGTKSPDVIIPLDPGKLPKGNAGRAMQMLMKEGGYSKAQAAGIVGNLQQESGLDPNAGMGKDGKPSSATMGSVGIAQWRKDRYKELREYAKEHNKPWNDFDTQMRFLIKEMKQMKVDKKLEATKTPAAAAMVVRHHYEKPKDSAARDERRIQYASNAFHGKNLSNPVAESGMPAATDAIKNVSNKIAKVVTADNFKYKYDFGGDPDPLHRSAKISKDSAPQQESAPSNIISMNTPQLGSPNFSSVSQSNVPNPTASSGMDYLFYFTGQEA